MTDIDVVALLLGVAVGIVLIVAQLKLFSIDRTLKEILIELRGTVPSDNPVKTLREALGNKKQ